MVDSLDLLRHVDYVDGTLDGGRYCRLFNGKLILFRPRLMFEVHSVGVDSSSKKANLGSNVAAQRSVLCTVLCGVGGGVPRRPQP